MEKSLMAVFSDRAKADQAVQELETMGYETGDISVIARGSDGTVESNMEKNIADTTEGATSGAATGAAAGGLAGLLAGIGVIPALAGFLIGGPIAAAIGLTGVAATAASGAMTGAAAGGLLGILSKLGFEQEEAESYSHAVEQGGVALCVPVDGRDSREVRTVMEDHGATHLREVELSDKADMA